MLVKPDPFSGIARGHFGVIYADPATQFATRSAKGKGRSAERHYRTMSWKDLRALPVGDLAADDAVLFLWTSGPQLLNSLRLVRKWGFTYKTLGFDWMKADTSTVEMFPREQSSDMKMGYWSRAGSEQVILATRGHPTRLHADVRQGIIEPAREHSRKPDCVYKRIERLVGGPYLELFARTPRGGWTQWGDEIGKFRMDGAVAAE